MKHNRYFTVLIFLISCSYTVPKIEIKDDYNLWAKWIRYSAYDKPGINGRPLKTIMVLDIKYGNNFTIVEKYPLYYGWNNEINFDNYKISGKYKQK